MTSYLGRLVSFGVSSTKYVIQFTSPVPILRSSFGVQSHYVRDLKRWLKHQLDQNELRRRIDLNQNCSIVGL